jgi:hypothetical protein
MTIVLICSSLDEVSTMDERICCQACGADNPPDSIFCERCGARVATAPARPLTPPPYETVHSPYAQPTPYKGRAKPLGAWKIAKSIIVGFVLILVMVWFFGLILIAAGAGPSLSGILLTWVFLPGFVGTLLSGYLTVPDIRTGAVTGGIAGGLLAIILGYIIFGLLVTTGAEAVYYSASLAALLAGGVLGGAAGGYLKERKVRRQYSSY